MKKKLGAFLITIFILVALCFYRYNYATSENNKDEKENNEIVKKVANIDIIEEEEQNIKDYLTSDIISVLEKYPDLSNTIKKGNIELPVIKNMIPQGIAIVKSYIFITYYSNNTKNNSLCYIMDKNGNMLNVVQLDTNSHVGGISYDEQNELIWIPDNDGVVNIYSVNDFFIKTKVNAIQKFDNISNGLINYKNNKKVQVDYLCVNNNFLYIGSFSQSNKGKVKIYEINNNEGIIELTYKNIFSVPNEIQGIAITNHQNNEYLVMSQSYGRNRASYLTIYKYDENIKNYNDKKIKKVKLRLPPMLEQIYFKKNLLYIIFESNATQYNNCLEIIDSICILDFEKILSFFDNENNIVSYFK